MDTIAHGLWAAALYKIFNIKLKTKFKLWEAVAFGVFPDIFSFTISFIGVIAGLISGNLTISMFHPPESSNLTSLFNVTHLLYDASHSIIIFILVFFVAYLVFKKPIWILGAWLFHIIVDIPSHGSGAWATPYLWPMNTPLIDGFPWWQNPWVEIINYSLLLIAGIYILINLKKK